MYASTNAFSIKTIHIFSSAYILQVSLLLLFTDSSLFLKVLVPYPDLSDVHSGYASKLQVCY